MKKILIILLIFCIATAMPLNAFAAEKHIVKEDSKTISEDIKSKLEIKDNEEVIAVYNIPIWYAFSKYNNIDEILAGGKDAVLEICYLVTCENTEPTLKAYRIDRYESHNPWDFVDKEVLTAFHNQELPKVLSKSIEVENIYYISGEPHYQGNAIYYETNEGDFVYYRHYSLGDGEYFFPVDAFCKYQKSVMESRNPLENGGTNISNVWDLSKYDINSDKFDPFASIPSTGSNTNKNDTVNNNIPNNAVVNNNTNVIPNNDKTPSPNMMLWIGIPCIAVLLISGSVFGVIILRKRKV